MIKIDDYINQMTINERISQMLHESRSIKRLDIDAYNWWNEGLHGVARAGIATVFPQAIALAATFDEDLIHKVADVVSTEARAKYNESRMYPKGYEKLIKKFPNYISDIYFMKRYWYRGLTCWSPNINIFRDPRWGRGHETFGEDPYLTSRLAVNFIKGLQGNGKYLKTIATPKHFAVHSGPEGDRHHFNVKVTPKDLHETYLYAFKESIIEGKAESIMAAYNAVNNIPASASSFLLEDILRKDWKFEGFVVSDCGGIRDIDKNHKHTKTRAESAAIAVNAGCDLNCGKAYKHLKKAYKQGLISKETIDKSVKRLLTAKEKLGMFAEYNEVPYNKISPSVIDSKEHRELNLQSSRESLVLLKNNGILPLKEFDKIAVIGPNADNYLSLLANYHGTPSSYTTPLQAFIQAHPKKILYSKGCDLYKNVHEFDKAVSIAEKSDIIILFLGLSPKLEGEEGDKYNIDSSGDKVNLQLPGLQNELLRTLKSLGKPIITINISGSAIDLEEVDKYSSAVIQAFYPGQDGGQAIHDLILGKYSPSGRLPVTFYYDRNLPSFDDYSMDNRTYRFMKDTPLYPFGYGLSYADITYSNLEHLENDIEHTFKLKITNSSELLTKEIVQIYYKDLNNDNLNYQLCKVKPVILEMNSTLNLELSVQKNKLLRYDDNGYSCVIKDNIEFYIGSHQPDIKSINLSNKQPLKSAL